MINFEKLLSLQGLFQRSFAMYFDGFKLSLALLMFVLTLVTGLAPLKFKDYNPRLMHFSDYFACGIFLGTAFFHMLPDAVAAFKQTSCGYPWIASLLLASTAAGLMWGLQKSVEYFKNRSHHLLAGKEEQLPSIYILTFFLVFHSLVEGIAIGINKEFLEVLTIFLAIFLHKGSESFVYSVTIQKYHASPARVKRLVFLFACMTPLGILLASGLEPLLYSDSGALLRGIFEAIAAGTFFFLCLDHLPDFATLRRVSKENFLILFGIGFMALLSYWA